MSSVKSSNPEPPEYVDRFQKIPAPYQHALSSYRKEAFLQAMIAWMLDINVRASIRKREYLRTRIKIGLYIKYMERLLEINNVSYTPYFATKENEKANNANKNYMAHMQAKFETGSPIPITIPITTMRELIGTVSDSQTMEYKLHQLEVIRFMGSTDTLVLERFNNSTRVLSDQSARN